MTTDMKRATGIGGIFFKSTNVAAARDWYRDDLGFKMEDWGGAAFVWADIDQSNKQVCYTSWSLFKDDSKYFEPSVLPYMFNYRVHDLKALIEVLRNEGVNVVAGIDTYDYGLFAWIMDPEGRKIELWEAVDSGFGPPAPPWTDRVTGLAAIYFKSDSPAAMKAWYKKHLDITGRFNLRDAASNKETYITWEPLDRNDNLFADTDKPYIFGYRVHDLKSLIGELKQKNFLVSEDRVVSVIDPDGNKIILVP
jgi:predicted enzyme related to lactoylglutathione lyase